MNNFGFFSFEVASKTLKPKARKPKIITVPRNFSHYLFTNVNLINVMSLLSSFILEFEIKSMVSKNQQKCVRDNYNTSIQKKTDELIKINLHRNELVCILE